MLSRGKMVRQRPVARRPSYDGLIRGLAASVGQCPIEFIRDSESLLDLPSRLTGEDFEPEVTESTVRLFEASHPSMGGPSGHAKRTVRDWW